MKKNKKTKGVVAVVRCGCGHRRTGVNSFFKVVCKHCLSTLWIEILEDGVTILPWRDHSKKKIHKPAEIETYFQIKKKNLVK